MVNSVCQLCLPKEIDSLVDCDTPIYVNYQASVGAALLLDQDANRPNFAEPKRGAWIAEVSEMTQFVHMAAVVALSIAVSTNTTQASPPPLRARTVMAPKILEYPVPPAGSRLVLSLPVWRAESTDETPYQMMQLCYHDGDCETLADLRGTPGISIASDPSLAISPDHMYAIVLRHVGVDPSRHTIRAITYELYGVSERGPVAFRDEKGNEATTDNIRGWAPTTGHGLQISTGYNKTAVAFPVAANAGDEISPNR